jgi:hypothetical protein
MSATDDMLAKLDEATNTLASELAALRDEVSGGDTATAQKFQPLLDKLTALGQDPANPVPTDPGTPASDSPAVPEQPGDGTTV